MAQGSSTGGGLIVLANGSPAPIDMTAKNVALAAMLKQGIKPPAAEAPKR